MKRRQAPTKSGKRGSRAGRGTIRYLAKIQVAEDTLAHVCSCHDDEECRYCEMKLYSGLPREQVRIIRALLSLCHTGPGETVIQAGDPSTYLYVIREGQVKLTRSDVNGHEHLIGLGGAGYLLGFDTIGNPTYSYSAQTLTPGVFCRIRHCDIVRVLMDEPRVSLNVLLAVNEQLAQARDLICALGQKTAAEKLAAMLLNLFPPRTDSRAGMASALHLSRLEMADILGLTEETVSRIMASLRRQGIIEAPPGHIVIRARARLQALAGHSPCAVQAQKKRSRRDAAPTGPHAAT